MQRVHESEAVQPTDWATTSAESVWLARGSDGLQRVAPYWNALDGFSSALTDHSIWSESWILSQNLASRCTFVLAERQARHIALAPLVLQGGHYCLPGAVEIGEPMDLLHTGDRDTLVNLCNALAKLERPVHLDRVPAASSTASALREAYRGRGNVIVRPAKPTPFLPLDPSFIEPERHLSPRRRSDLGRAWRRAKELGVVEVCFVTPPPDEVLGLLFDAFKVEAESWKARAGTAILHDPARKSFFETYSSEAAKRGLLRLGFLRIAGRAVAMQVAVVQSGRYWLLKVGYDESYARVSPGILLLAESIKYAAQCNLSSYEFLGAVTPWIQVWNPHLRPCLTMTAYPANLIGLSLLSARILERAAVRVRRRCSSWWKSTRK